MKSDLALKLRTNKQLEEINKLYSEHDWSITREIYERNKKNLNLIGILYRGTKISYNDIFINSLKYADIFLNTYKIEKGDEIPACMSNTPEYIYMMLGAALIGAKMNFMGEQFDHDYISKIINDSKCKVFFATDDIYSKIAPAIRNTQVDDIVLVSLTDSLNNKIDPYYEIDKMFYDFRNKVEDLKPMDKRIIESTKFLDKATKKCYKADDILVYNNSGIKDDFLVTYTSGSTNSTRPKAILDTNLCPIAAGRFHDYDLSGVPSMSELVTMQLIHTQSKTGIVACATDTFCQSGTLALEPIYDKDFIIHSMQINKPNIVSMTVGHMIQYSKDCLFKEDYKNYRAQQLIALNVVGEPCQINEEKLGNKALNKIKAGTEKLPFPIAPVKLSMGGGDCEHGGIFFTLFRRLHQLDPRYSIKNIEYGLKAFGLAEVAVLKENGQICKIGERGVIAANSPLEMKEYLNEKEATAKLKVADENGKEWLTCNVEGYMDFDHNLHMESRIGNDLLLDNGKKISLYEISKTILKDTKRILSCETVLIDNYVVAHIEFMPGVKQSKPKTLMSIEKRCNSLMGEEITSKVVYRIRNNKETFPLMGSGKRGKPILESEGITKKCIKPFEENGQIYYTEAEKYIDNKKEIENPIKEKIKEIK